MKRTAQDGKLPSWAEATEAKAKAAAATVNFMLADWVDGVFVG